MVSVALSEGSGRTLTHVFLDAPTPPGVGRSCGSGAEVDSPSHSSNRDFRGTCVGVEAAIACRLGASGPGKRTERGDGFRPSVMSFGG